MSQRWAAHTACANMADDPPAAGRPQAAVAGRLHVAVAGSQPAQPGGKRKRALARLKNARLGLEGIIPSIFRERVFHENGDMTLRIHALMGPGLLFKKSRVDAMLAGGRENFVRLLKKLAEQIVVRLCGAVPDGLPTRDRPTFTKQENLHRQAEQDASKMVAASAKAKTTLDAQRSIKDYQSRNGWFPCMKLDATKSCFCECVFRRANGLAKHVCDFARGPTGTAHRLVQGDNGRSSSSRVDTANDVVPGRVTKAVNTSRFNFTLSDDAQQNAPHLLAHRIANREMQAQCPDLGHLKTYSNKSDGAGVYASMQQILALRVMHEVDARYPRCTESSQSVAGDGKGGCDRLHAEIGAQGKKQLNCGHDQTNADQHSAALVANGGIKGTMVSVVTVHRGPAADEFHNLKYVDIGADDDEPAPAVVEEADYMFDADLLTMREWATQRGTFHTTALNREKLPAGEKFVDDCFMEGATGANSKVHASQVRERMVAAQDAATGLDLFGPGHAGGPVWEIKDIASRYAALFNNQKASALLGSDSSPITNMANAKCGCGKQKTQQLQVAGLNTLGDLLALNESTDAEVAIVVSKTRSGITVASIRMWIMSLLERRKGGGGGGGGGGSGGGGAAAVPAAGAGGGGTGAAQ